MVRTLPSTALTTSRIRAVDVAGTRLLLARLSTGEVVAFAATCPHQRTDLQDASVVDGGIQCPLHSYVYDGRTGENIVPARDADPATLWKLRPGYLPVHAAEERDGWIWVGPDPRPPPASYDAGLERPPAENADAGDGRPPRPPAEVVQVVAGTTFELRLPTTPRPGFVWRVDTGGPALAVVEERFQPGDPSHHLVRVAARRSGRATVRCLYARPWDREPAEVRAYDVVVAPA